MKREELLKTVREKGILLEKEIFDLLESFGDVGIVRDFLDNLEKVSGQKIITKKVLGNNFGYVQGFIGDGGKGK